jgi:hypothetical protein
MKIPYYKKISLCKIFGILFFFLKIYNNPNFLPKLNFLRSEFFWKYIITQIFCAAKNFYYRSIIIIDIKDRLEIKN